ncbi:MAG: type IV pilus secretin PilQ [Nevskia sp.]|nr:type IV pilus secretin PilQ [Nevskia sp.]
MRPGAGAVRWLAAALALAAVSLAPARADGTRALQSIDFVALNRDSVMLTLTLSGPAPQPAVFAIDKPARLSIDLVDTQLALSERYRKINVGLVRSVAAAQGQGRTRVVVEMVQLMPHTVTVQGNKILVQLTGVSATPSQQSAAAAAGAGAAQVISNIDFRRGDKGEGRVVVTLSDSRTPADVRQEGGNYIARFRGAALPDRLLKRLDVLDFATPVKYVDARRQGSDVEVVVTPSTGAEFEQFAYQSGDQFIVELQPMSPEKLAQRQREQPTFTGEHITLSFQSVDIRSLLQIIADVAGTNMVVSDSVQGSIAMRLQNVPWDQALDIILRTKGLGMRRQGNVMLVAPLDEIQAREKQELDVERQKVQLAPLHSELIQVNYAKASDIGALIRNKTSSILSERGSATVDERTNTLLVLETADRLNDIRALIQRLDVPVRQVLIESRIVVATDNFERDLGSQLGVTQVSKNGSNGLVTTSGSNTSVNQTVTQFLGSGTYGVDTNVADRYNVNLPAAPSSGSPAGLALALLGNNFLVDLELTALQLEAKGEVVSSPRVITANGKPALIKSGVEIPYQESTSSGATSVSFKDAVLSLTATPQITPDGRIIMDLIVHDDSVGSFVPTGQGGSVPSINTREVDTQVLVDNGQTVVLGGVYEQTVNRNATKVPFLGDIPLLGYLFRETQIQDQKREVLVFITPKIVSEGLKVE